MLHITLLTGVTVAGTREALEDFFGKERLDCLLGISPVLAPTSSVDITAVPSANIKVEPSADIKTESSSSIKDEKPVTLKKEKSVAIKNKASPAVKKESPTVVKREPIPTDDVDLINEPIFINCTKRQCSSQQRSSTRQSSKKPSTTPIGLHSQRVNMIDLGSSNEEVPMPKRGRRRIHSTPDDEEEASAPKRVRHTPQSFRA